MHDFAIARLEADSMTSKYKRLLSAIGLRVAAASHASATPTYEPYADEGINEIYNLLFCDDVKAFAPKPGEKAAEWQTLVFSKPADAAGLEHLAADPAQDGRVRFLAYSR